MQPGELNHYLYEPKGVAAVIAPWNFPLAISMGMASAAMVTGNPVVFKPSSLTPIVGHHLAEIFAEAGLPAGVFNYVPARGSVMGDSLVDHPDISLIAFTGSLETGLRIIERASRVQPGQTAIKKVIAEMGGKNAIIIDERRRPGRGHPAPALLGLRLPGTEVLGLFAGHRSGRAVRALHGTPGGGRQPMAHRPGRRPRLHGRGMRRNGPTQDPGVRQDRQPGGKTALLQPECPTASCTGFR
jgi:hypothetical protein